MLTSIEYSLTSILYSLTSILYSCIVWVVGGTKLIGKNRVNFDQYILVLTGYVAAQIQISLCIHAVSSLIVLEVEERKYIYQPRFNSHQRY